MRAWRECMFAPGANKVLARLVQRGEEGKAARARFLGSNEPRSQGAEGRDVSTLAAERKSGLGI